MGTILYSTIPVDHSPSKYGTLVIYSSCPAQSHQQNLNLNYFFLLTKAGKDRAKINMKYYTYSLISVVIATQRKVINADYCTLCPGTNTILYPDVIAVGDTTCQVLALDAAFLDGNDTTCALFQQIASARCSCGKSLSAMTPTPSEAPIVATAEPSTSPTSIFDRVSDCGALLNGNFPSIPSDRVDYITFDYKAEILLEEGYSLNDDDHIINELQDVASNVVSAGTAGCYDDDSNDEGVRLLRKVENQFVRRVVSDGSNSSNKIFSTIFALIQEVEGGKRKDKESKEKTHSFYLSFLRSVYFDVNCTLLYFICVLHYISLLSSLYRILLSNCHVCIFIMSCN